jgi:hypothetical protein
VQNSTQLKPEHLLCAAGGLLVGAWWVENKLKEAAQSRAEHDDPELVAVTCEEIGEVLDQWEPESYETEDDFVFDLGSHLDQESSCEVEVMPGIAGTKPDVLVEDVLALEVKVNPNKAELDRCVGQCAGYSRRWVTWIVLINTPPSKIGWLENLLADKGLDHILVWSFS